MANTIPCVTVSVRLFRWSLFVDEPHEIRDSEEMRVQDFRHVMHRCMQQCARASFMVNGPNREVKYLVELWDRGKWNEVCRGRTKLRDKAKGDFGGV